MGTEDWLEEYIYHDKAGNIIRAEKVNSSDASNILGTNYGFNGDILTGATGADIWSLDNDANGNITSLTGSPNSTVTYNYDNKLKYANMGSDTISVKYDPMGNRIVKHSVLNGISRNQRFIVDINSDLPVVLCVLDCSDTGGAGSGQDLPSSLEKLYYHVGAQVIAQKEAGADGELFYYVHDRLGSVRAVVDIDMLTVNEYSYDSFGKMYQEECYEAIDSGTGRFIAENPFKYTGQYYDGEIGQYYLRARMYDPQMRRFTGRDPLFGKANDTLSLHRYLYCQNDSMNCTDLSGKILSLAVRCVVGGLINGGANAFSVSGDNTTMGQYGKAFAVGFLIGSISALAGEWNAYIGILSSIAGVKLNNSFIADFTKASERQRFGMDLGGAFGMTTGIIGALKQFSGGGVGGWGGFAVNTVGSISGSFMSWLLEETVDNSGEVFDKQVESWKEEGVKE